MGYSLNRAIPMGIIGFVVGAGLVILLRGLQSMEQLWDPQLGGIVGGVFAAVAFLSGIGGLSAAMAAHEVVEPEEDEFGNELPVEDHHHHGDEKPASILGQQVWTVAFWVTVLFVGVLIFAALPGGFGYTVSNDPTANVNSNGFFEFNWFGSTLYVSKLVAFIVFMVITMVSLFAAAGGIAAGFIALNNGIKTVKAVGNQPLTGPALGAGAAVAALPSGDVAAAPAPVDWPRRILTVVKLVVVFLVLYVLFYEVAVGLVLPQPYWLRIVSSAVSVIAIEALIFYPKWVLFSVGRIARFSARIMRAIPAFLFQRD